MSSKNEIVMEASTSMVSNVICAHHWVIETPAGPLSHGRCKLCGQDREFRNSPDNAFYWEDDASRKAGAATSGTTSTPALSASPEGSDE